jgi:hypothetical protein
MSGSAGEDAESVIRSAKEEEAFRATAVTVLVVGLFIAAFVAVLIVATDSAQYISGFVVGALFVVH